MDYEEEPLYHTTRLTLADSFQMLSSSSSSSRQTGSLLANSRIQNDEESAEQVEDEFLRGNFRHALARGNRLLRRPRPRASTSTFSIHSFCLWKASYELRVHANDDDLQQQQHDRVGAVVLQAWYELWKLQNNAKATRQRRPNDNRNEEQQHLMPFLQAFCSDNNNNNSSSMSLELAWMWVQFLWAINERPTCVRLALPLFQFAAQGRVSESEVLFLVCKVLPCLKLSNKNNDSFWDSWYMANETVPGGGSNYKLLPHPIKESIEALQRTLPSLTSHLDLSPILTERLERHLETLHQRAIIDPSSSALIPALNHGLVDYQNNNMSTQGLPGKFWKRIQVHMLGIVRHWILLIDDEPNGESCWSRQNRAMAVALCVISGWWTWRNSRRLVQLLQHVVRLAAAPARELLQALLPRQEQQIANHPSA